MQRREDNTQPIKSYTLAQITAAAAFALAFIASIGQFVVIFLPDVFSKLILAPVLSIAVISVVVGLVASRQASREHAAQMERERHAHEVALRNESQAREEAIRSESQAREVAILGESHARKEGFFNEKWMREITVWTVAGGLVLGTFIYLVALIKVCSAFGKSYGERMMREIWESKK